VQIEEDKKVEDKLTTWMAENNSTDWPTPLKFFSFKKTVGSTLIRAKILYVWRI